jgi:DNA topoisomerase IB
MIAFGKALPLIRRRVSADLARPGLPREKVWPLSFDCWSKHAFEWAIRSMQKRTAHSA